MYTKFSQNGVTMQSSIAVIYETMATAALHAVTHHAVAWFMIGVVGLVKYSTLPLFCHCTHEVVHFAVLEEEGTAVVRPLNSYNRSLCSFSSRVCSFSAVGSEYVDLATLAVLILLM